MPAVAGVLKSVDYEGIPIVSTGASWRPNFQPIRDILGHWDVAELPSLGRRLAYVGNIWTLEQKRTIQKVNVSTAAISVLLSVVTAYWFVRMRKKFRHK